MLGVKINVSVVFLHKSVSVLADNILLLSLLTSYVLGDKSKYTSFGLYNVVGCGPTFTLGL